MLVSDWLISKKSSPLKPLVLHLAKQFQRRRFLKICREINAF
jgi:hypothetical protein